MGRNTYENLATPACVVDYSTLARGAGVEIDWSKLGEEFRSTAVRVQLNGGAAANATSITVDPLPLSLDIGDSLYFGQTGEFARVTAAAAKGATTVTVEALPQALEDNDVAVIGGSGRKTLKAFTALSPSGDKFVPRSTTATAATCFIVSDAEEGQDGGHPTNDGMSGYGQIIGGVLYENWLPDADSATGLLPDAYKTELKANGTGFVFQKYFDSRAA